MNRFLPLLLLFLAPALFAAEQPPTLALGAKAPDFHLLGVDGKNYSLKDFVGSKILVIIFTCTHCPTAQYYEDRLKKLVEDYRGKGVALAAINPNDPKSVRLDELGYTDLSDSFEEMKLRAKYKEFNFPYLYDGDTEESSRAYGPTATPHAFVFDQDRKLRYHGRIDDSERPDFVQVHDLRNTLDALIAGQEIEVKQTKNFGCSVKWAVKNDGVKKYMEKLDAEPVAVEKIDAAGLKALLKNESGKLRLINFWATWCGPCITEFPDLVTMNRMYRHRAFELVTVAANFPDEEKPVLEFLKKQHASNKNYLFGDRDKYKLMDAFDKDWTGALPFTVLVSADGKIVYRHEGAIDDLEVKRVIVRELKEDRFK